MSANIETRREFDCNINGKRLTARPHLEGPFTWSYQQASDQPSLGQLDILSIHRNFVAVKMIQHMYEVRQKPFCIWRWKPA